MRRAALLVLLFLAVPAAAELALPAPPARRLNDYAGALTVAERERLEQKLATRERTSSNQVVVAIFRSLAGENLEDYSIRLAQAWRIGQKGLDNGVIFLVFLDDRKMRIEVGYGLEASLTDATASSIIRDVVAPRFRERRYAEGIEAALDAIDRAIAGTYARRAPAGPPTWLPYLLVGVPLVIVAVIVLAVIAANRSARTLRRGWTGGRRGWTVASPGVGGSSWSSDSSSSGGSSSSDSFSGGGGSFGGGGSSGEW